MIQHTDIILRPDTSDAQIAKCVFQMNEYKLDSIDSDAVIVDVGAHIGCFSMKAYNMGARKIYAFEANPDNFLILKENTERWGIVPHNNAVRGNYVVKRMGSKMGKNMRESAIKNMGGIAVRDGDDVDVISLNDIVSVVGGKIDLLKLDCEGSEYPIIYDSPPNTFKNIKKIIGEFHPGNLRGNKCEGFICTPENLENHLISLGYSTKFIRGKIDSEFGHFFCTK